jgi:hypothetical protein
VGGGGQPKRGGAGDEELETMKHEMSPRWCAACYAERYEGAELRAFSAEVDIGSPQKIGSNNKNEGMIRSGSNGSCSIGVRLRCLRIRGQCSPAQISG